MKKTEQNADLYQSNPSASMDPYEENRLEIENRIRNLLWTVSGDYELSTELDLDSFRKAKEISLYDAVKQGAFAKFFDQEEFGLYLVKKVYLGADEGPLMGIAQLAVDGAAFPKIAGERPGVPGLRKKAFGEILEQDFRKLNETLHGRLKIAYMRSALTGNLSGEKRIREAVDRIFALQDPAADTMTVIRCVDEIYNSAVDRGFARRNGNLEQVLAVPLSELKKYDWTDYLKEEAEEARLEDYLRRMQQGLMNLAEEEEKEKKKGGGVVLLDEEAVQKMYSYMELNYGRSYLNELEQKKINHRLCRGVHADCSLYFTDGILSEAVKANAQYELARRTKELNRRFYHQNRRVTRQNIQVLTEILRHALITRNEEESYAAEYGKIVPNRLWRVGRSSDGKLFDLEVKKDNSDFVVEILIDASGSQRDRTSKVALQGYILCEALSNVGIPHSVFGFCSFWDYTVMRRFRGFDEGREANERLFEFYASANNRDGLAVRSAGERLLNRSEDKKILIVLSDGRPNDIIVNRPNSKNPTPYFGDYAIKDTASEIRKLRNQGIAVLGVFAGMEQDLLAERKIFGKDFAYIRDIKNFSHVTGMYLKKQLTQ